MEVEPALIACESNPPCRRRARCPAQRCSRLYPPGLQIRPAAERCEMGSTPAPKQGELDGWIGSRIRDRRRMLGLAQHELAEALGISHQQLQKYEAGKNRISASRLWWCADVLDMPMDYFFFERPVRQAAGRNTPRSCRPSPRTSNGRGPAKAATPAGSISAMARRIFSTASPSTTRSTTSCSRR